MPVAIVAKRQVDRTVWQTRAATGREEDVAWLEIAMYDLVLVEVCDAVENCEKDADRWLEVEAVDQGRHFC